MPKRRSTQAPNLSLSASTSHNVPMRWPDDLVAWARYSAIQVSQAENRPVSWAEVVRRAFLSEHPIPEGFDMSSIAHLRPGATHE